MLNHFCVVTSKWDAILMLLLAHWDFIPSRYTSEYIFRQILFYDYSDSDTKNLLHNSGGAI